MEDQIHKGDEYDMESTVRVIRLHPDYFDEEALWNSFRTGDDKAFIVIFERYGQVLYNYGCKIVKDQELVRDNVQDLFFELFRKRKRLGRTDAIKFYLFRSLRRKLVRTQTGISRISSLLLDSDAITISHESALIEEQTFEERRILLESRLSRLTNRQKEAVFLRYYEELSYDKIAEIMGVRKQAVYNLINQSIQILRK